MCPIGACEEQIPHGLYNASVRGRYSSYYLINLNRYRFSFCEACLRKMFMLCKIKPKIEDANIVNGDAVEIPYEEDQRRVEYRIWEDDGGAHRAYLNKKCNAIKDCPNNALYTVLLSEEFTEHCCCEEHRDDWKNTINAELVKFIPNVLKPFL